MCRSRCTVGERGAFGWCQVRQPRAQLAAELLSACVHASALCAFLAHKTGVVEQAQVSHAVQHPELAPPLAVTPPIRPGVPLERRRALRGLRRVDFSAVTTMQTEERVSCPRCGGHIAITAEHEGMGEEARSAVFIVLAVNIGLGVPVVPAALLVSRLPSVSARRGVIACYFAGMALAVWAERRRAGVRRR